MSHILVGRFVFIHMSKYVHKKGEIVHCPFCRGVILRDLRPESNTQDSFVLRCPHCQCDIKLTIGNNGKIIIEKDNGHGTS